MKKLSLYIIRCSKLSDRLTISWHIFEIIIFSSIQISAKLFKQCRTIWPLLLLSIKLEGHLTFSRRHKWPRWRWQCILSTFEKHWVAKMHCQPQRSYYLYNIYTSLFRCTKKWTMPYPYNTCINWRDVQRKNVINNVDVSSIRAPWQNGPYKSKHTEQHKNTQNTKTQKTFSINYVLCFSDFFYFYFFGLRPIRNPYIRFILGFHYCRFSCDGSRFLYTINMHCIVNIENHQY